MKVVTWIGEHLDIMFLCLQGFQDMKKMSINVLFFIETNCMMLSIKAIQDYYWDLCLLDSVLSF